MKLNMKGNTNSQPDPFIFKDGEKFYIYVTAAGGVEAYSANDIFGEWEYHGAVICVEGGRNFWAPSVIRLDDTYYMYVSFDDNTMFEHMHVASSKSPLGPFENVKKLYDRFSIDSHVVQTKEGLFLLYAEDNVNTDLKGTRVFIDRLVDPYTPANICKEVIAPTIPEEMFQANRHIMGMVTDWYTLEGPFWFKEGDWQYIMYSGGCYENSSYHIGYAAAKSTDENLLNVEFTKYTDNGKFAPVLYKNADEEGVGHHSVIKLDGQYYAIYHGRDEDRLDDGTDCRIARICKLTVEDGVITAERM